MQRRLLRAGHGRDTGQAGFRTRNPVGRPGRGGDDRGHPRRGQGAAPAPRRRGEGDRRPLHPSRCAARQGDRGRGRDPLPLAPCPLQPGNRRGGRRPGLRPAAVLPRRGARRPHHRDRPARGCIQDDECQGCSRQGRDRRRRGRGARLRRMAGPGRPRRRRHPGERRSRSALRPHLLLEAYLSGKAPREKTRLAPEGFYGGDGPRLLRDRVVSSISARGDRDRGGRAAGLRRPGDRHGAAPQTPDLPGFDRPRSTPCAASPTPMP